MPRERGDQISDKVARWIVLDQREVHETLEQACKKHNDPVKHGLEQDRSDQRRPIVATEERHRIGDQHRFADNESSNTVASMKLLTAIA